MDEQAREADRWWQSLPPDRKAQVHRWLTEPGAPPVPPADQPPLPIPGARRRRRPGGGRRG